MQFFKKKRYWLTTLVVIILAAAGAVGVKSQLPTQLAIGAGWKAKILSSGLFISGRPEASVLAEDVPIHPLLSFVRSDVEPVKKEVTASFLGIIRNRAVSVDKLGTILLCGVPEATVRAWPVAIPAPEPADPANVDWPTGDRIAEPGLPANVDGKLLDEAVTKAFAETGPDSRLRTRAVLVVYDDRLIAERYAPGITADMPLIGWSMSKSVTSALTGILVGRGRLSIKDPAPVPEWQSPGDARRAITLEQLLQMSSGLEWEEAYETKPVSDVNLMLFTKPDTAAYAASLPLAAAPGSKWNYSTGTTQIISRIIRGAFADQEEYLAFPRTALFNRIGMRSAVICPDASGTFVGGAFVFACARDWARFGLLYLHDGMWGEERILPEGWAAFTRTPAPAAHGVYGAQFWLNQGQIKGLGVSRLYAEAPRDLFYCAGYQSQLVIIIPSRKLVLVRLGMTTKGEWAMDDFILNVLRAIKE
jgi:CubicO group peptidase (beta-lactamase class C family)